MDVVAPIAVIALLAFVVLLVSAPLRGATRRDDERDEVRRGDLEAAKASKYREIRDAEMDFRTGKLSEQDWRALDRELRAEAVAILREIDALGETAAPPAPPVPPAPGPPAPPAARAGGGRGGGPGGGDSA
jgi:hypothetical protein